MLVVSGRAGCGILASRLDVHLLKVYSWIAASVSQSKSELLCNWQSGCLSWCRTPSGAHDQVLVTVLSFGGCPLWREDGSVMCQSQSAVISWLSVRTTIYILHVSHWHNVRRAVKKFPEFPSRLRTSDKIAHTVVVGRSACLLRQQWHIQTKMYRLPSTIYRVSQEECAILREGVPYVKIYRYNPKRLCPKLNGYGDNGQRSLKLWQVLHICWLPNTYCDVLGW
jgi:hypothetical protein